MEWDKVVTIIIAAVSAYAGLVSAGVLKNPRRKNDEARPPKPKKTDWLIVLLLLVITATSASYLTLRFTGVLSSPWEKELSIVTEIKQGKERDLSFGGYKWRVLEKQEGRVLLITEDIIEQRAYNGEVAGVTWETCSLRKYLNGDEFKKKFSEEEWEKIEPWDNENQDNQWYATAGGNNTTDKVFLLSIAEVIKYFGDSGDLAARKGWYGDGGKGALKDGRGYYINDQYNGERVAKFNNSGSWWWLRSPGINPNRAAHVNLAGPVYLAGTDVDIKDVGVRPAMWVYL